MIIAFDEKIKLYEALCIVTSLKVRTLNFDFFLFLCKHSFVNFKMHVFSNILLRLTPDKRSEMMRSEGNFSLILSIVNEALFGQDEDATKQTLQKAVRDAYVPIQIIFPFLTKRDALLKFKKYEGKLLSLCIFYQCICQHEICIFTGLYTIFVYFKP